MASLPAYPTFMNIREGKLLLSEADWPSVFGTKYGIIVTGAGTVTLDTDHFYGGTNSIVLTTDALASSFTSINTSYPSFASKHKIYAMEAKFIPDVTEDNHDIIFFLNDRTGNVVITRAQVTYTVLNDAITYTDENGVEQPIPGGIPSSRASLSPLSGAGDQWNWMRVKADFDLGEYVSIEYISATGYVKVDMRGIKLRTVDGGVVATDIRVAIGCFHSGTGATTSHVTDLALTGFGESE